MNKCVIKATVVTVAALLVGAALLFWTGPVSPQGASFGPLAEVSPLELPPAAAQIVRNAAKADQPAVAREVTRKIAGSSRPGVLPYVVSGLCQVAPESAPQVVATAVLLQPERWLEILQAGLSAAQLNAEPGVAGWNRGASSTPAFPKPGLPLTRPPQADPPPRVDLPFTAKSGPSTELNAGAGSVTGPGILRDYSAP